MAEKQKLTKSGYTKLNKELRDLIDNVLPEVIKQLAEARAQGDLSENADYDAARNKQAEVDARIKEIEHILENAEIISENKSTNRVSLGSTVKIKYVDNGKEAEYTIVGTVEADPFTGKISNASPMGEAIIGKTVGDVVEVKAVKTFHVEILSIETR